MAHQFDPSILREYDIRGVVGETLFTADAEAIGRVFGTLVARGGGKTVCVGFDGRLSSPDLEAALVRGLIATGAEVTRIGRGPTPMLYYAAHTRKADGGIMVTGSHNPPTHNGFKMVLGGEPFLLTRSSRSARMAAADDIVSRPGGKQIDSPIRGAYVERLLADYSGERPLTVVWDAGNGAAGEAMAELTKRLPGRHIALNAEIDGRFPAHHPDPTDPKNLESICSRAAEGRRSRHRVRRRRRPDRRGRRHGANVWGDQLLALLAREVLAAGPAPRSSPTSRRARSCSTRSPRLGGMPLMWRTGHSLIKAKMAETGFPARRRDERAHLLRRSLVRLRRRALCRGAVPEFDGASRCSESSRPHRRVCPNCSTRRKFGSPAVTTVNSSPSMRSSAGSRRQATSSSISTVCGSPRQTAGGCCARRTRSLR